MSHSFSKGANPPKAHPNIPLQVFGLETIHLSIEASFVPTPVRFSLSDPTWSCFASSNFQDYRTKSCMCTSTVSTPNCSPRTELHHLPSIRAAMCWLFWEGSSLTISRAVRPLLSFMFTSIPMARGVEKAKARISSNYAQNHVFLLSQILHLWSSLGELKNALERQTWSQTLRENFYSPLQGTLVAGWRNMLPL